MWISIARGEQSPAKSHAPQRLADARTHPSLHPPVESPTAQHAHPGVDAASEVVLTIDRSDTPFPQGQLGGGAHETELTDCPGKGVNVVEPDPSA